MSAGNPGPMSAVKASGMYIQGDWVIWHSSSDLWDRKWNLSALYQLWSSQVTPSTDGDSWSHQNVDSAQRVYTLKCSACTDKLDSEKCIISALGGGRPYEDQWYNSLWGPRQTQRKYSLVRGSNPVLTAHATLLYSALWCVALPFFVSHFLK